jgi:hypothetical protein
MNIYVSDDVRHKWPGYEFKGRPFKLADGKRYIRAYSKFYQVTHFYCFEDDWFWHDTNSIPKPKNSTLKKTWA